MNKGEEIATILINALTDLDQSYGYNLQNITDAELENRDIEHKLELERLDRASICKLGREQQKVLRQRRKLKDENDTLKPLYDYFNDPKFFKIVKELQDIRGKIKRVQENQKNRIYTPRIRKDLAIIKN